MTATQFVDTNILVYAASSRPQDREKKERALEIITREEFAVSGQVLAEFYVTVTRKGAMPMAPSDAVSWIVALEAQTCVAVDAAIVKRGAVISEAHRISYWDSAIVAAAEAVGATTLYTEDLSHGQLYGSVTAVNPFIEARPST